ncbi:aminotransferase class V-fold PLP-dependent enzyme [Glaciecola sp. SC05]|uniref:aminotransferase class V-fold PLP-dependent enzyme n=1 Tax=Glaciecola sp. SC05 TaxID=1987355 RepID=UPI003526F8D1
MNTFSVADISAPYAKPDGVYCLAHSVGPLCKSAKDDLNTQFLTPWQALGGDAWPTWLEQITRFNNELGILLTADANDFCPQPSVSIAFSQWLAAVSKNRPSKQRRVVLMHQDAFASLGFAVKGLCDVYDLELRFVTSSANDLDAWTSALALPDVFACLVTHAHSNTGYLSDVEAILKIARANAVLGAVDIAQSVGIIPISLSQWRADCVVGSCVKWLSGGPGAAFLYIPSEQANELMPEHLAWFSHENPFEFDIRHFSPAQGVMRFWGGTPSIAPYVMAASAIHQHNRFGTAAFREHNLMLMHGFLSQYQHEIPAHYQSLLKLGADASAINFTSYKPKHSATLCLPMPISQATKIKSTFSGHNIKFDERNGVVRLSFSAINNQTDVAKALACYS